MTPEEAAEIVLKGETYEPCFACKGEKYLGPVELVSGHRTFNSNYHRQTCQACGGWGDQLIEDYKEACALVGRPITLRLLPALNNKEYLTLQSQWGLQYLEDQKAREILGAIPGGAHRRLRRLCSDGRGSTRYPSQTPPG